MKFIRFIWECFKLQKKQSYLDSKMSRIQDDRLKSSRAIEASRQEIGKLKDQLDAAVRQHQVELDNAEKVNKKLEEALDALREELETARELTIPGLVASQQILIDRWRDESNVIAMRTAIARAGKESEV